VPCCRGLRARFTLFFAQLQLLPTATNLAIPQTSQPRFHIRSSLYHCNRVVAFYPTVLTSSDLAMSSSTQPDLLLVKAKTTCQGKDYLSKQRLLVKAKTTCQWLLVQVMVTCPRLLTQVMATCPPKSRLMPNGNAVASQGCSSMATCQSKDCLSKVRLMLVNGKLPKIWLLAQVKVDAYQCCQCRPRLYTSGKFKVDARQCQAVKSRILVQVNATCQRLLQLVQLVQVMATCPSLASQGVQVLQAKWSKSCKSSSPGLTSQVVQLLQVK